MTILDYNRVLRDLNGLTPDAGLAARSDAATRSSQATSRSARRAPDEVGMVARRPLAPARARPEIAAEAARSSDPVARLPVTLLAKNVIEPIFGVLIRGATSASTSSAAGAV